MSFREALSTAAAFAAVFGALWAILKLVGRTWRQTFGARWSQRRLLNQLFPGGNVQYIEQLLGTATLVTRTGPGTEVRRYRLLDCWVSVGVVDDSVKWVSITVTDHRFSFRTNRFTMGLVDIRLGKDCFIQLDKAWSEPVEASIGNREQRYIEATPGVGARRFQKTLAAYTNLGTGKADYVGDYTSPTFVRERTTINSLAIASPFADLTPDCLLGRQEAQVIPLGRRRPERAFLRRLQRRWRLRGERR